MDMACSESGDGINISKLNDGESELEKRIEKVLRQVKKWQGKKPATNKRAAKINMILELLNQLQEEESEEESEEDDKLESMKKLEEEKKLKSMKKLEEETKLEEEKKLKSMKKLEEDKEFEEMLKQVQVDMRNSIIRDFCFCYDSKLTYDRDSTDFCNPEEMLRLKGYAQMAIDVFNKRQPIQYGVEEIDIATTRLVDDGFIVFLLFTAMADAVHQFNGADFFRADIHGGTQLPEVTYVDYSFLYDCM